MIDRVEISIIEEQQPRWLSFLNQQQDFLERIANEFINIAAPNGKLAPNLQRQNIQLYRVLASDLTMYVYNMDDPVIGGYTPERSRCVVRSIWRPIRNRRFDLRERIKRFLRRRPSCRTPSDSIQNFAAKTVSTTCRERRRCSTCTAMSIAMGTVGETNRPVSR